MLSIQLPDSVAGRFAAGALILCPLVASDEGGVGAAFAVCLAAVTACAIVYCKEALKPLSPPYWRGRGAGALLRFLSIWLEILSLLSACAMCARVLSACLDSMTGGKARIMLLGRETFPQETWPDVLGVSIIILVTGMFMLGLENSPAFTVVLLVGTSGCGVLLCLSWALRGDTTVIDRKPLLPAGWSGFLSSAGLSLFSFITMLPTVGEPPVRGGLAPKFLTLTQRMVTCALFAVPFMIYSTVIIFLAVLTEIRQVSSTTPLLHMLESRDLLPLVPAMSCLLVLGLSGAIIDLFPLLFQHLVLLSSHKWQLLAKSLSYESQESGSPVLAVFAAGSLCGILAFACPLTVLVRLTANGALLSGLCCAIEYLLAAHKPIHTQQQEISAIAYNRLPVTPNIGTKKTTTEKKPLWFLPKSKSCPRLGAHVLGRKGHKKHGEREREWLLLGEPASPQVSSPKSPLSSSPTPTSPELLESVLGSDIEETTNRERTGSESDSSTDIDAIVDEYRQKIKVSTAGPMQGTLKVPTVSSWRKAIACTISILMLSITMSVAAILEMRELFFSCLALIIIINFIVWWIPKRAPLKISPTIAPDAIALTTLLAGPMLLESWPGVSMWILAGLIIFLRLNCCCSCADELNSFPIGRTRERRVRIRAPPRGSMVSRLVAGHRNRPVPLDTVALNK